MNLPNKLSLLRMALVPVMVLCMYIPGNTGCAVSMAIFIIAAFTDFLDGHIARRQNIVTTLGKFIDPVADKLLVLSALIMLVSRGMLPAWVVVIVLFRDLCVDSLRLVAAKEGFVIAASPYGKVKTVLQMVTVVIILSTVFLPALQTVSDVAVCFMVVATLFSGFDYFQKNGKLLFQSEEKKP